LSITMSGTGGDDGSTVPVTTAEVPMTTGTQTPTPKPRSQVTLGVPTFFTPSGPVGGGDDEDDLWMHRMAAVENGQLNLQRRLEEVMRPIPEMVVWALAVKRAAEQQPRDHLLERSLRAKC
ncbi:UNVERIFIED_CONTAM: hypothetical protein K2H54_066922, partial [Gekko kuhli]